MVQDSTTKVGSMIVALALLGMVLVTAAPSAQAAAQTDGGEGREAGACVTVYTDPVGAAVDPWRCLSHLVTNSTGPSGAP
jgi:hypothetical protein